MVDETGDEIATYSYDVWGKQAVTTTQDVVRLLPLAYRGYFMDNDTDLYFIDKRLYNPNWGNFLDSASAEAQGMPSISEYNMYTYWENNPVWYMTKEEKEAYEANSIANYLHNKNVTANIIESLKEQQNLENEASLDTFIYNQKTDDINQYRCGVVTSRPKGCGWISTYNAAKLFGLNLMPEDIIRECENMGIFLQGFFGVHPFAVAKFFVDRGHDIDVYFGDFVDLDTLNNLSEVNIIFYDGNPTGHYAVVQYDEKDKDNSNDDVFIGYNVFGSNGTETLTNGIAIPETKDDTSRKFTGKVLISVSPKETATFS